MKHWPKIQQFFATKSRQIQQWLHEHHYSTPFFVARETLHAFQQHNSFNIAAALSFYALFALIPLSLLLLFLLSHMVTSSAHAVNELTELSNHLMPKFSHRIMIEVYNISKHQAAWGVFGTFAMFWAATPLASSLRSAFHTIAAVVEQPSILHSALKDALAVTGILVLLCIFTFSGVVMDSIISHFHILSHFASLEEGLFSLTLTTLMITAFYRVFFPANVQFKYLLAGSFLTTILWLAMRPAFGLFLFFNQSYSTIFGGMKNMFISIGWLYYTFAVFLLGTELIATLWKKEVLLIKPLFSSATPDHPGYQERLLEHFGKTLLANEKLFSEGDPGNEMFYVLTGLISIRHEGVELRQLQAGDYFGEMALLTGEPRTADAIVISRQAEILLISAANLETLLLAEPAIAMTFLKEMAARLRMTNLQVSHKSLT